MMLPNLKLTALGPRVCAEGILVGYPMPLVRWRYLVLVGGAVIRSSDVQFMSIPPVAAHKDVPVAVPTPELSLPDRASDNDAHFQIYIDESDDVYV